MIYSIAMCVAEAGLLTFITIRLLVKLGIYDDFKQYISDCLEDLERKLKEYEEK